jgi:hypothetical protein
MVNYQNGKIYKIISDATGLQYIGSTTVGLSQRMSGHRSTYRQYHDGNKDKYTTAIFVLQNEDAKIVLIEDYPCDRREELLAREAYYIETNICVNKNLPFVDMPIEDYRKKYRDEHIDDIREKAKIYYLEKREKIRSYQNSRLEKAIECRKAHNVPTLCTCGRTIQKYSLPNHIKTKKHIAIMKGKA